MAAMTIIGFDPSLTSSGLAGLRLIDGEPEAPVTTRTVGERMPKLPADEQLPHADNLARIERQVKRVLHFVSSIRGTTPGPGGAEVADVLVVAVEGPSFNSKFGSPHERAGLWWLVAHYLRRAGAHVVVIPPAKLKQYATGKGGGDASGKPQVMAAVARAYPQTFAEDDNQADAIVLLGMLARELGHPIEASVQRVHPFALSNVQWPEFVRAYRAARP